MRNRVNSLLLKGSSSLYHIELASLSSTICTSLVHLVISAPPPLIIKLLISVLLALSKTKTVGDLVKDVDVAVCAAEGILARTKSVNGDISKRVNTLAVISADGAVDNKAVGGVLGVDVVVAVLELDGGLARALVNLVVLAAVGGSTDSTGNGISRLPVGREVGAGAVVDALGLLGVLRLSGLLVGTDGTALGAVVLLLREVLGIGRAPDTAVISF
jgi:hypothetical protein